MSEPSRPRPVPGPPRPGPVARPAGAPEPVGGCPADEAAADECFADLAQRPVTEHVAVFEAEHARLERELRTIDQL